MSAPVPVSGLAHIGIRVHDEGRDIDERVLTEALGAAGLPADLYFAVENPAGVSAKALAAILGKTLSGLPAREIAQVTPDIVEKIFRQNISMGKGLGLMSMVQAVRTLANAAERSDTTHDA